ncbi:adenylate/guanylate cyclase domain-containing protein [Roseospirillum parvum]|uniref:Adenylate cyclase, class 3 n=1 Tax=Roseospirillum parvum TaxID=83401 RepID=A0A1G7X2L1_9PROT|nr:adenylate/guanylate cyclase domain-containing protein [Roseospirillum parvum]SDG78386.1 Adenylate cyclase, class 3 [Roseospirillum parvum]
MTSKIFKKESAIVEDSRALLARPELFADAEAREGFSRLLEAYEKQMRSTQKLLRLSDRNEAQLNELARDLEGKNSRLEELSDKLSRYLAPQIYKAIFEGAQDVSLATRRKKLTVFFSDLKGFTETSETLQPEALTYLLNDYFSEMSTIAIDHGATIDKFIGDAMLMFFGDPHSDGDRADAAKCVRMAVRMQQRMKDLRARWRNEGFERPFSMRIGINTGYCNVGNFGSTKRMDYTIIGAEVNLAARLESQADPDGILMSYETYALVRDFVETEERSAMRVKGIAREIRPFAVTNIYDPDLSRRSFIRKERYGLKLLADLERLQGEDRRQAIAELEEVIHDLKTLPESGRPVAGDETS